MKKYKFKIILIILIIIATSFATHFSNSIQSSFKVNIPKIESNKQYEVVNVIDGDTFDIKIENRILRVRMLGMDTPETLDLRKPIQCFGRQASDKTKELLIRHTVSLQTDSNQSLTDKYSRLLAYVYRDDGLFINKYLLENGYAREYTYNKAYKKQKEFKKIENKAKVGKIGLWGLLCFQK